MPAFKKRICYTTAIISGSCRELWSITLLFFAFPLAVQNATVGDRNYHPLVAE